MASDDNSYPGQNVETRIAEQDKHISEQDQKIAEQEKHVAEILKNIQLIQPVITTSQGPQLKALSGNTAEPSQINLKS